MSAFAHFAAFTLTAVAALMTLGAAVFATDPDESINLYGYLILLGSLLLALGTGTGIITVLGLYLANIVLIGTALFTFSLFRVSAREGISVTTALRQLSADIRAHFHTPTFDEGRTRQDTEQETVIWKDQ